MLVLIADKFPDAGRTALEEMGLTVQFQPDLGPDTLPGALASSAASVLVVRSTRVTAQAFEAASDLSLVVRAGAGVNTIDLDAASARGVYVANCPGKNAVAVAELAMGLLLAVDRHIAAASADLHAGRWNKKTYGKARGLCGRTLSLLGFGAIARAVAERARAFGMNVRVFARTLDDATAEAHGVQRCASLDELLSECDALSVHVPLSDATRHLLDEVRLRKLPKGAYVIHTARGGVVDDAALAKLVAEGHLHAGVDVFEGEPSSGQAEFTSPLLDQPTVVATPHIGASTDQAQAAIADEVLRILRSYVQTGQVPNTVNVVRDRPAGWTLVVRHRDRVGVLAGVLEALREEDLNVQEMQNVIFTGNEAASATLTLEREPSASLLGRLRGHPDILAVDLRAVT